MTEKPSTDLTNVVSFVKHKNVRLLVIEYSIKIEELASQIFETHEKEVI